MRQLLLFPDMYDDMINAGINWIAPSKEEDRVLLRWLLRAEFVVTDQI